MIQDEHIRMLRWKEAPSQVTLERMRGEKEEEAYKKAKKKEKSEGYKHPL